MKIISSTIALASISLFSSNTAISNEELPEPFSEYGWLLEGAREVIRKNTDFAPVTTCFDLNRMFTGETTSSIQKERAWLDYEGKLIPLTGTVEEVKRIPITNDYVAFFKCTNSESFMVDFTVEIPKEMEEYAFDLTPGERRDMHVRLTDYGEMMGVSTKLDSFELERESGEACFAYLHSMNRSTGGYDYACYGTERQVTFESSPSDDGSTIVSGMIKQDDGSIMFTTIPENTDIYYAFERKDNEVVLRHSGNEGSCVISSEVEKRKSKWYKENLNAMEEEVGNVEELENINHWYVNLQQSIGKLDKEEYSCEDKQLLRTAILILFDKARKSDGVEYIKNRKQE